MKSRIVCLITCVTLLILWTFHDALPQTKGNRDAARPHWNDAEKAYKERRYEDAAKHLEKAYALDPDPLIQYNIGQAYRNAGKFEKALASYQKYLKTCPSSQVLTLTHVHMAECYRNLGKKKEEREAFRRYLAIEGASDLGKKVKKYLDGGPPLDQQDKRDPQKVKDATALWTQGTKLIEQKKYTEAAKLFMQGWQKYKFSEMLYNAGTSYAAAQMWTEAVKAFNEYLKQPFAREQAYVAIATCYHDQYDFAAAVATYERYMKEHPNGALATVAYEYISAFQFGAKTGKKRTKENYLKAKSFFDQAKISYKQGLYEIALRDFQHAEQFWPDYKITYMIARCLQRLKKYNDAVRRFEDTIREDKTQHIFTAHLHAAECLLALKKPDEALKHVNTFKAGLKNMTAHDKAHVKRLEQRIAAAKKKS